MECSAGTMTFGGGTKNKVVGTSTVDVKGLPALTNVLHVEGLR